MLAGQFQHGGRRVGGDDAVTGLDEVPGQQAAPATQLDHDAASGSNGLQQLEDARRAPVGMKSEAEVVHEGEVRPVVGNG